MENLEGKFRGRAVGQVVLGASKHKGTPQIEFYCEVTQGPRVGERARFIGFFTDSASGRKTVAERTIEALQFCGWEGEDLSEFADGELHGLDANEVELVIEMEEYEDSNGETRSNPRVQWINNPAGFLNVENAMKPEAAAAFGDKMRGLVLKMKAKGPAKADSGTEFPHGANVKTGTGGRKGW